MPNFKSNTLADFCFFLLQMNLTCQNKVIFILFYSILSYSIPFHSVPFYSILFYSIIYTRAPLNMQSVAIQLHPHPQFSPPPPMIDRILLK